MVNENTEAAAVAEIVKLGAVQPQTMQVTDGKRTAQILVTPAENGSVSVEGIKHFLDDYDTAPERREGTAKLADLASLVAHARRFADADSALFASPDPKAPSLTAVLDYHRAGAEASPRFGKHRAVYAFPLDEAWTTWMGANGREMSQKDFAAFIEARLLDVADPTGLTGAGAKAFAEGLGVSFASPSTLLNLSRGMSIRVNSRVQEVRNLATGEAQIAYTTEHQDERGQPLKVPGAFVLGIPVFVNGALYQVPVRLRYRHTDGALLWKVELYRPDRYLNDAFKEACERAATETGLPLFYGSPES